MSRLFSCTLGYPSSVVAELGGHRLDRVLARGGSAEVWLAWHPDRPGPAAIKRAGERHRGPGSAPDLRHEAEVLARVRHHGVVALIDVVDDPPGVALVLDHLAGGTLRDLLAERGTLAPGELVAVLEPVAAACAALARAGMVHGDLKPDHVGFTDAGAPVLVDLGSASAIGSVHRSGTPAYLDPLVAAGGAPSPSSEVFALAVVAYEVLTGRLPHRGDPAHVLAAAAAGSHRSLRSWPGVPAAVADVVERGLDPDPGTRFAAPVDLVAALRAAVAAHEVVLPGPARTVPLAARPPASGATATIRFGPAPPVATSERRADRRWSPVALGASLALVLAGVVVAARSHTEAPARPAPVASAGARCAAVLPPPPPGVIRRGDLDGDGCREMVRWDGATLVVATVDGVRAFRMRTAGGQLVLGDWDGDGVDSPGLYDPVSGVARLVDRLPAPVGAQLGPSRVVELAPGGRAVVDPSPPGSGRPDRVRVVGP